MLLKNIPITIGTTVSFVGAGGKTSLMFSLANELANTGYRVLVTTTTAIFHPDYLGLKYTNVIIGKIFPFKENRYCYDGFLIVAGFKYDIVSKKIIGYNPKYINLIGTLNFFDFIFVEADGAKMKSIKCPASHEPVIPEITSTVIGCVGLDCIGKYINNDNVHRPNLLLQLCNKDKPYNIIGQNTIVTLAISKIGLFKGLNRNINKVVFLNKADNVNLLRKGKIIASKIKNSSSCIRSVVVACLKDTIKPIKMVL